MFLFFHTDLTDLTDFYSFGVFTVRQGENRCLQRKRIREICEIRVGLKKSKSVGLKENLRDLSHTTGRSSPIKFRA